MPTYGYRCPACGTEFEVWQRMTAEARADCPSCGAESKRLFFPPAVVFNGPGFYKTDSRSGGSTPTAPAAAPAAATETPASAAPATDSSAAKPAAGTTAPASSTPSPAPKPPPA